MKHTYCALQIEHPVKIQSYYNVPPFKSNTIDALKTFTMERLYTDYSNKNTPFPSQNEYKIQLKSKVEKVWKRMRRRALHFLEKPKENNNEKDGFISQISK